MNCPNLTIEGVKRFGMNLLKESGIESFSLDAALLLMFVTGKTRTELLTQNKEELTAEQWECYQRLLLRRKKHEPMAYITETCEFMSLPFFVSEAVLIPRPDTEILIETILSHYGEKESFRFLEIGTGSGCISVSLAHYRKNAEGVAVDISEKALAVAKRNCEVNGVSHQITFLQSDLFQSIPRGFLNSFDCIVSNPPYIERDVVETLAPNVKNFEPSLALDGGVDGLDFYRSITEKSALFLKPKGTLFYEIGYNQKEVVMNIVTQNNFSDVACLQDLGGNDRVIYGRFR